VIGWRLRSWCCLSVAGLLVAGLLAALPPVATAADGERAVVPAPPIAAGVAPRLEEATTVELFLRTPKIRSWLGRYPPSPTTDATFDDASRTWKVGVWSGKAGQIASGVVDDRSGRVTVARAGPQVAWGMARGNRDQFGGPVLLRWPVWAAFSVIFFLGLGNLRRPVCLRNLDLIVLLSFGLSLAFFNEGRVFQSAALAAPPLAYLALRCAWIGVAGRRDARSGRALPLWVLAVTLVFLVGFRIGMNVAGPTAVIDVGYAGVIGAHRILDGQSPYGRMPQEGDLPTCGRPDSEGRTRERIQANGRCEASNVSGDTYGPVSYAAYVPFVAAFGWTGKWDRLWAAHAAAIVFDLLVLLGLYLAGRRLGSRRLGTTLAFGWAAFPFTAYTLNANANDALMPAILVWGFVAVTSPFGRGAAVAAAGMAKFAAFVLAPLWLGYGRMGRRSVGRFAAGFAIVSLVSLAVCLFEPRVVEALRTLWERTIAYQLDRESPFSPWGWGQYRAAGIPDLHLVQIALQLGLLAAAGAAAFLPRRRDPLVLAALTAALLAGFQLVLTHWFYLYLPWILPFVLLAILLPAQRRRTATAPAAAAPAATP
jgi:hypothetical protein